jgi:acyl-CoA reductase-like NAD-dependent aldehyde dehydrogenase
VENCVVIKPGSDTPMSLEVLMVPRGALNMAIGHCSEISMPPARGPRIATIAFSAEQSRPRYQGVRI